MYYKNENLFNKNSLLFRKNGFSNAFLQLKLLVGFYFLQIKNDFLKVNKEKLIKTTLFLFFAGFFFPVVYYLFLFIFKHFYTAQIIGPLLVKKLLYTFYMTFTIMIILSSIVASIPVLFFSREMDFLFSSPVKIEIVFILKYIKILIDSCWMILLITIPIFAAYSKVLKIDIYQYLFIFISHIPFFIICVSCGIFLTLFLIKYFPGQQIRNFVIAIYGIFLVAFFIYFRMLEPEKLTGADFNQIMELVRNLKAPDNFFFPHSHLLKIINNVTYSGILSGVLPLMLLTFLSIIFFITVIFVAKIWYFDGFSKKEIFKKEKIVKGSFVYKKTNEFSVLLKKDVKYIIRDTTQWIQLVFLFGIIFLYLFNIYKLPADLFNLREVIFFLNIGFIGLVMSAVGARLILPVISMEGRSFWILKTIPISIKKYVIYKFIIYTFFIVTTGLIISFLSLNLLKTHKLINFITIFSTVLITFVIAGCAIGLGAVFADFKIKNPEDLITGIAGLFYMFVTFLFIALLLFLEAGFVKDYYLSKILKFKEFHIEKYFLNYILIIIIAFFIIGISMWAGIKKLEKIEV